MRVFHLSSYTMDRMLSLLIVGAEAGLGINIGNIVKVPKHTMCCCLMKSHNALLEKNLFQEIILIIIYRMGPETRR